jgi:hypothetical protein
MDSNNSKSTEEGTTLLGRKRKADIPSTNLLYKRFLTGEIDGEYEKHAIRVCNMFSFDWDDEKYVKPINDPSKLHYNLSD